MKKKNDLVDKAEVVDDPSKRYSELKKINEEMGSLLEIETNLNSLLDQITKNLSRDVSHDPDIIKPDTVSCIKIYFDKLIKEFEILKQVNSSLREKLYSIILNLSILMYDYCHRLRSNNFSIHGTKYLMWIITLFESNIILSGIKFLRWRIKLYTELSFAYEDNKSFKSAFRVIEIAMRKVNELKAVEEQQGQLADHIKSALIDNFRILKNFEYKYGILSGVYPIDIWKKKIEETFISNSEKLNKFICIVNSVSNLSSFCSLVLHEGLKINWKVNATSYLFEQMKGDFQNIRTGLVDYIEKQKREVEKRERIKHNPKEYAMIVDEYNKKDALMNKQWRSSIKYIPIELHMELLKACYDCKMWKEFLEVLEVINLRILYRRVEIPYLSELDIIVSSIPYSNIPNKYEKIDIDININNYKAEVKRLREEGKYNNAPKGETSKPSNTAANKGKPNDKKKAVEETTSEVPYEKIEGLEHSFVYLIVRRSHNPQKAIINFRIVMSNDSLIKSHVSSNERAIAIPIKTYQDNLYEKDTTEYADIKQKILKEKNKLTPYLIYQKTSNGLTNEEEKLSAIIDILPFISNSPYAEPPLNYIKNETELTIFNDMSNKTLPSKINYNFSHNYINICHKTDQIFHIVERECEILKALYELEMSYIEDKKTLQKLDLFLSLNFSIEKLEILSNCLYNSIQGPLGNFFLTERRNFLYDNSILMWKKYLKDFLIRVDYFYLIESELDDEERYELQEKIFKLQTNIFTLIYNLHYVLSNIKLKDPIIFAYISLRLSDFSERTENIKLGMERAAKSLEYLNSVKEDENIFGLSNYENKHTFTTFTCDNNKIFNLINTVENKYDRYVRDLNFKRRKNYRTTFGLNKFSADEEFEEDFESYNLEREYENRLSTVFKKTLKKFDLKEITDKEKTNLFVTENENTLNCLYLELCLRYYRLYLKFGMSDKHVDINETSLNNINSNNISNSNTNKPNSNIRTANQSNTSNNRSSSMKRSKLSTQTMKKLDIIKGSSATQVKESIDVLKGSLQEAGKLEPDKPNLQKYEKRMLSEISKNCYLNVLFQLSMTYFRSDRQDQKYILTESSSTLSKCFAEEDSRAKYYENYFFYIKSIEKYNLNINETAKTYYPYNLLYKSIMIDSCDKLPEPILIHKTSTTASFIFPIVKIKNNQIEVNYKITNKVALYGQKSTGTNIVALYNKQLNGTGNIKSVMNYQSARNLKPNEKYIFAYAGYDNEETIINGIGASSKEVENYFPLPLHLLAYHLCKISFELKHYEICKDKAKNVFTYFTERCEVKDISLDNKTHSLFFYKLKYDFIQRTCFLELEGVAFTFLFFAKCMMILKQAEHSDDIGVNLQSRQKNILKNLNVLMLGLEIACYIRHFNLIKIYVKEIYNVSSNFIKQKNLYKELGQLFIRLSIGINMIPNEIWDSNIRNISALVTYQILIFLVNNNEMEAYKKLLVQELGLEKKRFYFYKYKYMKKFEENKKGAKTDKKDNKDAQIEELVEADGVLLKDLEKEIIELDDFILNFGDYNEISRSRINNQIVSLEKYASKFKTSPELSEEIERRKKELNEYLDVWEGYKNEGLKFFQKFATTSRESSEKYYEICSKFLRKTIENNFTMSLNYSNIITGGTTSKKDTKENLSTTVPIAELLKLSDDILLKESDVNHVQNIFLQKLNFLTNDVIFIMKKRIKEFLDNVEKEITEEKNKLENSDKTLEEGEVKPSMRHITDAINIEKIRLKIEEKSFGSSIENEKTIPYDKMTIKEIFYFKEKYFWIGEILFNKALILFTDYVQQHKILLNYDFNNFVNNYKLVDIGKLSHIDEYIVPTTIEKDIQNRLKRRSKILEKLSNASIFFDETNSVQSFDNLIYFVYNLLSYDMITPTDTMTENQWCYLNIISEIAIKRLERIRKGEGEFSANDYKKEIEQLKWRMSDKDGLKSTQNFSILKKFTSASSSTSIYYVDGEKLIDTYERKINFDVYIEIICFTIQCTFCSKKWSVLSNLIKNFNNMSNDIFCDFTLPYLIEAQKNIWEKANENTKNKQIEINQRVALYETWKNSRKKNKRQQMITGEIPQEQLDFERDHYILSKELFIFESISSLLKNDKEKSEKQLSNLLNDSKNSLKAVNSCRKLFEKYQIEALTIAKDLQAKGENHFDIKSKSKALKIFASNLINLYKKAVQILKKRQENYFLIQILYEKSIIYYSENDIKSAEIFFNESLDTVFQKLYTLKDFRNLFENTKNLSEKYGIRQLLYAVLNLHKLGKYCYDNDLYLQRESVIMSGEIIFNILISYLPHPSSMLNFGLYRLSEINKNLNVFKSSDNVSPSDLLTSCIESVDTLIAYGDFEICLPMLCLCEYLACDIVKNFNYLHKSRILKIICLAELGLISESIQIYYKLIKKIDQPTLISYSINQERITGKFANLSKEFKFLNNSPPEKNQDCINAFLKLTIDNELKFQLGCNLYCELLYARSLILFKIFEKENYTIYLERSDNRTDNLTRVEKEMRENLLMISTCEELNNLNNINLNNKPTDVIIDISFISKKIDEILNNKKITRDELDNFYTVKFNKSDIELRKERIDLICKIRVLISRVYSCQNLTLQSSGVLLKCIEGIKKYCNNQLFNIESAEDYIFDFKNTELIPAKGGKPSDTRKPPQDNKNKNNLPTTTVNLDEEVNKIFNIINESNIQNGRTHPNAIYWFKLQYLNLLNNFKLGRFEDCTEIIKRLIESSQQLNIDVEYAVMITNYAEFLYYQNNHQQAINLIREARQIIWLKMSKLNYMMASQNYVTPKLTDYLEIDKNLKGILKEREAAYSTSSNANNKKPPDNKKKEERNEIPPINFNSQSDPNNKISDIFENINKEANNSDEGVNIYFKYNDILCRIDIRYVLFQLVNFSDSNITKSNLDALNSVLNDLEIISKKLLFPHNSFKILLYYLFAKLYKFMFVLDLQDFLKEKMMKIAKKYNLEILTLSDVLNKFSNYYNERCTNIWIGFLLKSKENLEKSLTLVKGEFYTFENGFNIHQLLLELADVNILLAEYRPSQSPKYSDFNQIVSKIQCILKSNAFYDLENDDLPYLPEEYMNDEVKVERANWLNDRNKNEKIMTRNFIRNSLYYADLSSKLISVKKLLNENIHDLATSNLIDPSKLPKDVVNQILENDYLNKKRNKIYFTNIIQKPSCDAFDVLNLFKNYLKETEFLTVNNEDLIKTVSKIHKYLKLNSSNYANKIYIEVVPCVETSDLNLEIIKKDHVALIWNINAKEIINPNPINPPSSSPEVNLIYIVANNSLITEFKEYIFGRALINKDIIVKINKNLFDLKTKLKYSLSLSDQKKKRDLKYHQAEYNKILTDFAHGFLKIKKNFNDLSSVENILRKDLIGEVTLENLDIWINATNLITFNVVNQKFNGFLYDIHLRLVN